ncbi:MAG TPA: hypothetical protein VN924_04530 [Bryobacteraceae bacterium]|nr:hypothetical protein [Bryobacteraceae bacterium]
MKRDGSLRRVFAGQGKFQADGERIGESAELRADMTILDLVSDINAHRSNHKKENGLLAHISSGAWPDCTGVVLDAIL